MMYVKHVGAVAEFMQVLHSLVLLLYVLYAFSRVMIALLLAIAYSLMACVTIGIPPPFHPASVIK